MKRLLHFQVKVLTIAAVLLMIFSGVLSAQKLIDTIAIIDGGSSGSRLYVYAVDKWNIKVDCIYPRDSIEEVGSKGMALSKLEEDPIKVKDFLDIMTLKYDNRNKPRKDLYILATAGMRMKKSAEAEKIYKHIVETKEINNYRVKKAMTISGQYEGFYAWIAVSLAEGKIGTSTSASIRTPTYTGIPCGIMEIGGASLQIAFVLNKTHDNTVSRPGFSNIYSKSYLGGGLNKFGDTDSGKANKDVVIDDLKKIKNLCANIKFYGVGWGLKGLFKDSDPQNAPKRLYVTEVCDILGLKNGDKINVTPIQTSWTRGAALDIVINRQNPQPFNYDSPN